MIGAEETVRVRYRQDKPEVESERRSVRSTRPSEKHGRRTSTNVGKRLSHTKREERERRQQVIRFKRVGLLAAAVLAVVLVVWGAIALYRAPIFTIEQIAIDGNERLSDASVLRLAAVPRGSTLVRLSTSEVEERLEAEPWVAEAQVDRDFPSTLRLTVQERRPAFVVDQGGMDLWVVSADGYWLGRRTGREGSLVVVRDVEGVAPKAGARVADPQVRNVLGVLDGLSARLRNKIESVSAPSIDETALKTKGDVEIFVGEATQMGEKDRIIREILSAEKGVVYINVRVTDRPTWRGLGGE